MAKTTETETTLKSAVDTAVKTIHAAFDNATQAQVKEARGATYDPNGAIDRAAKAILTALLESNYADLLPAATPKPKAASTGDAKKKKKTKAKRTRSADPDAEILAVVPTSAEGALTKEEIARAVKKTQGAINNRVNELVKKGKLVEVKGTPKAGEAGRTASRYYRALEGAAAEPQGSSGKREHEQKGAN